MTVVIDDLAAAATQLAPGPRAVLAPGIAAFGRRARALVAQRAGWRVVDHAECAAWVREESGARPAVVLDKLLAPGGFAGGAVPLAAHRVLLALPGGAGPAPFALELDDAAPASAALVVDDAAYTGATLAAAAAAVGADAALVGVATARAVARLAGAGVALRARHAAGAGEDILHLRDLVPWLPWSGRRLAERPPLRCGDGASVEVRLAPALYADGALFGLTAGDALLRAAHDAALEALERLAPGVRTVADLPALGTGVGVPVRRPHQRVGCSTPLRALLLA